MVVMMYNDTERIKDSRQKSHGTLHNHEKPQDSPLIQSLPSDGINQVQIFTK
jgi:hypothetical protein